MKNKNDFFKTQGFYIALYCCIGVFLVAGIVISARNIINKDVAKENISVPEVMDETKPVGVDYVDPYEKQAQMQKQMMDNLQVATEAEPATEEATKEQTILKNPDVTITQEATIKEKASEKVAEKAPEKVAEPEKQKTEPAKEDNKASEQIEEQVADKITEPPLKEEFIEFTDSDKMSWPVIGEIAMDYSVNTGIFDKTLNMIKTNDSIRISGEVGSQVKATADGVVRSVTKDPLLGNKVVIDNGNGWTTTYGQLQDNVLVSEGTVVKTGQVIGGIANPTRNSILDGSHLDFKVHKDSVPVDPKLVLAN